MIFPSLFSFSSSVLYIERFTFSIFSPQLLLLLLARNCMTNTSKFTLRTVFGVMAEIREASTLISWDLKGRMSPLKLATSSLVIDATFCFLGGAIQETERWHLSMTRVQMRSSMQFILCPQIGLFSDVQKYQHGSVYYAECSKYSKFQKPMKRWDPKTFGTIFQFKVSFQARGGNCDIWSLKPLLQ